jgi:hypothetical protein
MKNDLKIRCENKKVHGTCDKFGGHDPILSQFWPFVATTPVEMKQNNCYPWETPVPLYCHPERINQ